MTIAWGQTHLAAGPAVAEGVNFPVRSHCVAGIAAPGPNFSYGYAAQAVEVEVNLLTGQVRVVRVISVHDVGKAINRQQVEGQIEGCLAQAIGYALIEDFQVAQGEALTRSFSTYLVPTVLDVPSEIVPVILELADPHGPYGARGVAEMALEAHPVPGAPGRSRGKSRPQPSPEPPRYA